MDETDKELIIEIIDKWCNTPHDNETNHDYYNEREKEFIKAIDDSDLNTIYRTINYVSHGVLCRCLDKVILRHCINDKDVINEKILKILEKTYDDFLFD